MGQYNYSDDYENSVPTVKEIENLLKSRRCEILEECNTSDYDIKVKLDGIIRTFEIKEDFECHKTGNIAVEHHCRKKKSGIETTKSDFYVYKVHEKDDTHLYLMKTPDLKRIIKEEKYIADVYGGDPGSGTKMYLFRKEVIQEISLRLL